ncbi:MAG TPA: MBL fold metallo-hydrolase [Steroidobacteraceae bacterium]|nr:MBL fold metallo-hydrolase [Steroidobacteraceae bacterium]
MRLSFHGADQDVTGSCHLLEAAGRRILIDCGLFQGSRTLAAENSADFGFDPATIDLVLLTHAHLDHCGRLPLLVKRGFRGEIVSTAATRDLAALVLLDAAHLQAEESERNAEAPLYTPEDCTRALASFKRTVGYEVPTELAPGLKVTFFDAGHILGSASPRLEVTESGRKRTIAFSGDLGNAGRPLLRNPVPPGDCEIVVMETTYGDRLHRSIGASVAELIGAVSKALEHGGNVVIPTFALERAQEILYFLKAATDRGQLPRTLRVFLDSPEAIAATELFRKHREALSPEAAGQFSSGQDPLAPPGLQCTRDRTASRSINAVHSGAVILAGSGMATGGRVLYHLRRELPRPDSTIVFVGYAAGGTPARQIIDGAQSVRLLGESVPVRARVHTINGFSAHADRDELLAWHARIAPRRTFLVHGEADTMRAFAARLPAGAIDQPVIGQAFDL